MGHCAVVSGTESIPVVLAKIVCDVGMTVLFAILNVGRAVILEVFARALDSVVESLALRLAELGGRRIPIVIVAMVVLCS